MNNRSIKITVLTKDHAFLFTTDKFLDLMKWNNDNEDNDYIYLVTVNGLSKAYSYFELTILIAKAVLG